MKTMGCKTILLLQFSVLGLFVWSLTTSFETFDPSECTELFEDSTVFGKSYLDCVDMCKNTIECTGISYQRRLLRCRNHFTFGVLKKCPGYVRSMKSKWKHVDFREQSVVSGILLKGRDYFPVRLDLQQYVTKFKLLISADCTTFETIKDESGRDKIFDGNTQAEERHYSETVNRSLAERVMARCVQINPTAYKSHISLRFDVLGC